MNLFDRQIAAGRLFARLPNHQRSLAQARAAIQSLLSQARKPYVSCSWGKQSIIVAHLVRSMDPTVPLVFWRCDQTDIIDDFGGVRDQFLLSWPGPYIEQEFGEDYLVTKLHDIAEAFAQREGYDATLMGLAAEEGKGRRMGIATYGLVYRYVSGILRGCPLGWWDIEDYAAYIATHNLPMLSKYRRFGLQARTTSRIKASGATTNALHTLSRSKAAQIQQTHDRA